jgi:capsular exopolysaccharide synthesis family protein
MRSWRDMASMTGHPVLGRVPRRRLLAKRPLEAFSDAATGAAFRTLRANLEPLLREQSINVLLVTSPGKREGKTTIALLLAESLGRLGTRTLLVDADMKRPRLAKLAKLDGRPGLVAVLRNQGSLAEQTQPGWIETLSVLPTARDPEAGDLLARRFADVIKEAREDYDLIVIDAPPLLGTDDARPLARMVDGVILVVAAGSGASPVNEAVLALEGLRAPILGVVGNRLKESRSLYY